MVLMVIALVPASSGPGSSPGLGPCVVFLGKPLSSNCASLHPSQHVFRALKTAIEVVKNLIF